MSGSARCDVVLVGGGLVGACLAEELARAGEEVLVLDAGGEPGHATGKAAGVAVPSLRFLHDEGFYRWLGGEARAALLEDIARLEPLHGRFSLARPVLRLLTEDDLRELTAAGFGPALGAPVAEADVARLAPWLQPPPGRLPYLMEEGLSVNGHSYLLAVRAAAIRAGAAWWQERVATGIEEDADGVIVRCTDGSGVAADRVVVTAGAWSGQLLDVPVTPQRGQLVLLEAPQLQLECIVSSRLYLAPLPDGKLLVGATEEDSGFDDRCTAGSLAGVLAYALRIMPELASATVVETRAGLRPVTATGRPVVGRAPGHRRVYVAAGHAGHGLISARATARGLAAGMRTGNWDLLPEDFCPHETALAAGPARAGQQG